MTIIDAESQALHFLRTAYDYEALDELQVAFASVARNWAVTRFSVTQVMSSGSSSPEPILLFGHQFKEWDERYAEADFFSHDPCVPRFFRGRGAFTWTEVKPLSRDPISLRMFDETVELGLADGMIIPIHSGDGELLCARLMAEEPLKDAGVRGLLEGLTTVYATAGLKLMHTVDEPGAVLSRREVECLYWVSQEKSDDAIAIILNLSPNTVHTFVQRAKRKLGTATRGLAAAKARSQGLFVGVIGRPVTP